MLFGAVLAAASWGTPAAASDVWVPAATGIPETDLANIQDAVEAAGAAGDALLFPAGHYRIDGPIRVHPGWHVDWRGAGSGLTVIEAARGSDGSGFEAIYLPQFDNAFFDGSRWSNTVLVAIDDPAGDLSVRDMGFLVASLDVAEPSVIRREAGRPLPHGFDCGGVVAPDRKSCAFYHGILADVFDIVLRRPTSTTFDGVRLEGTLLGGIDYPGASPAHGIQLWGAEPGSGFAAGVPSWSGGEHRLVRSEFVRIGTTSYIHNNLRGASTVVGGAPEEGNTFTDVFIAVAPWGNPASDYLISHNDITRARWEGIVVLAWDDLLGMLPAHLETSSFRIEDNRIHSVGWAVGVLVIDHQVLGAGPRSIDAVIEVNDLSMEGLPGEAVTLIGVLDALVRSNLVTGYGWQGMWIFGEGNTLQGNDLHGYQPLEGGPHVILEGGGNTVIGASHVSVLILEGDNTVIPASMAW